MRPTCDGILTHGT